MYFDRWFTSRGVGTDFEELRQVILIEEFKRCVWGYIKTYLDKEKLQIWQKQKLMLITMH